jgi:glycine/D-amino acid oxidase-like deaminating enzyme
VKDRHDYTIVGAGSAGCALTNRLSGDPAYRMLLVESGPPVYGNTNGPAMVIGLHAADFILEHRHVD